MKRQFDRKVLELWILMEAKLEQKGRLHGHLSTGEHLHLQHIFVAIWSRPKSWYLNSWLEISKSNKSNQMDGFIQGCSVPVLPDFLHFGNLHVSQCFPDHQAYYPYCWLVTSTYTYIYIYICSYFMLFQSGYNYKYN